jgi:hypothetical protein
LPIHWLRTRRHRASRPIPWPAGIVREPPSLPILTAAVQRGRKRHVFAMYLHGFGTVRGLVVVRSGDQKIAFGRMVRGPHVPPGSQNSVGSSGGLATAPSPSSGAAASAAGSRRSQRR